MLLHLCSGINYIVEENIFVISLQAFSIDEVFKRHIKDCFKINGKQRIEMPQKCE